MTRIWQGTRFKSRSSLSIPASKTGFKSPKTYGRDKVDAICDAILRLKGQYVIHLLIALASVATENRENY